MHELIETIPDPDTLVALEPEELGMKLILLLREHGGRMFTLDTIFYGFQGDVSRGQEGYPQHRLREIEVAIFEAWAWLESQAFLVMPDTQNGRSGFRRLSKRALQFVDEAAIADYTASVRLPKSMLHPRIAERVWLSFVRGEYDTAVFQALREVEIAVREAGRFDAGVVGTKLMRNAFGPGGPLCDPTMDEGEAKAVADLYAGAIGCLKNPQSHRAVLLSHPSEAAEIVMLASFLLRMVDARASRSQSPSPGLS